MLVRCEQPSSGNWEYTAEQMWITDTDPGFVDAANGNFQLRPDAEVFQCLPGFRPILFENMENFPPLPLNLPPPGRQFGRPAGRW